MTTAFVLSGGAGLGAVQVGMLRALYERGLRADLIVGTSAGAVNGAYIASRPQIRQTADDLAEIWRHLRRGDVFPVSPRTGLLGFLGTRDHLVAPGALRKLLAEHLERSMLEELPLPLHVVTVDLLSGREFLLSEGPAAEAVMASAAIPGVLPPVEWGDRLLIDGGVANNTPISHAMALGADRIYVLPTGNACALEHPPRGALGMALHAISLLTQQRLVADIERHRDEVDLIVLPPPCPLSVAPIDFSRADDLIEQAYTDASGFFDRGGDDEPPIRMRMHDHRAPKRIKVV
jgi:NTE family protein